MSSHPKTLGPLLRRRIATAVVLAPLCAAAVLPAISPAAGLTRDAGRIEVNAMEYPWSAIGRVNIGGRGHCTGFLIGERQVLTAAHCLYDAREGRWRGANELHFVAGYQRDSYLINSRVATYERSRRFSAKGGATRKNAIADWAVLTLEKPIGREAGWLGLRRLDPELLARIKRGQARVLQAGYRRGWTHIMTVNLNCPISGFFQNRMGIVHACKVAKGDSGSPLLILEDGQFRVAGIHVLNGNIDGSEIAGALSVTVFYPNGGTSQAIKAVENAGAVWSRGRAPAAGSPASAVPLRTIDTLLGDLGHLESSGSPARTSDGTADRTAAIAAFESQAGVPVTGVASVALLGRLIQAAR